MPLNCSSLIFRVPNILGQTRITNTKKLTSTTYVGSCFPTHRKKTHQNMSFQIVSQLKFNQNYSSSSIMEDQRNLVLSSPGPEKYSKELDVAVRAVQMACSLCQNVQDSLISKTNSPVHSKDDNSPVTVAGIPITFVLFNSFSELGSFLLDNSDVFYLFLLVYNSLFMDLFSYYRVMLLSC